MSEIQLASVPLTDLQVVRAALESAYSQNLLFDLNDQYRKLHNSPEASNLTKSLQGAIAILEHYLLIALESEETEVEDELS